jgi:cysteine desulfurase
MDFGSARPVDPRVLEEILPYFTEKFGNPSSFHSKGFQALEAMNTGRERVARLVGADSEEIFFSSGATESNNLGIIGASLRHKSKGEEIIISAIEHMSVINSSKELQKLGYKIKYSPVDREGLLIIDELEKLIDKNTLLVSVMCANGEVGTIQPIKEISEIVHTHDALFHTDATVANGQIPLDVNDMGVDLMTLSSNDFYGPKGIGALYLRKGVRVKPQIIGGGQEKGFRSGSENIPAIVGMGKAAEIAKDEMLGDSKRILGLRDLLIEGVLEKIPESHLNGHPTCRLPNNVNIRFSYIEGEALILSLDDLGIQVSSGSACAAKTLEPSHVCLAMGLKHEEAHGSLVFTLGKNNNKDQVEYVLDQLPIVVNKLRKMSPLTPKEFV